VIIRCKDFGLLLQLLLMLVFGDDDNYDKGTHFIDDIKLCQKLIFAGSRHLVSRHFVLLRLAEAADDHQTTDISSPMNRAVNDGRQAWKNTRMYPPSGGWSERLIM
jgi:hypothetical protein